MGEENRHLRVLQVNVDRGRAATLLAEKRFLEHFDVACIQEPYVKYRQNGDFSRHRADGQSKAEVWTKAEVEATTLQELTTNNFVTVRIGKSNPIDVTSFYEEPGGPNCPRLNELARRLTAQQKKHVIAGDFNAHNAAWGQDATDARGIEVLAWANMGRYRIANDPNQGPTFQATRGTSFIDLTMTRNVEIDDWTIDAEETLSGHCYIEYAILETSRGANKVKKGYDFEGTNWEAFKTELRRITGETMGQDMELEERAKRLQQACRRTCQRKIARKEIADRGENEWFDNELQVIRTDTRRARRQWQLNKTQGNRDRYISKRNEYNKAIKRKKQEYIEQTISDRVEHDPWNKVWKLIGKKKTIEPKKNYRKEDGDYTQTDEETSEYLLRKYFPRDSPDMDNDVMTALRNEDGNYGRNDEPNFCKEEVISIVKQLKKRKATPATDRVPNEAMQHIVDAIGDVLLGVYQQCWEEATFPRVWKDAEIKWIPKKDGTPRPISLLPTLGKILDKITNKRLQQHLERTGNLNDRQYAYRTGRGTINALGNFTSILDRNKHDRKHQAIVALDLSNAFNNAWKPYIRRRLQVADVDCKLARLCENFLDNRTVNSLGVQINMEKGCPQGSSLGPTLWNLVMEGWFQVMEQADGDWRRDEAERRGIQPDNVDRLADYQAYADDQVVVIAGSSAREIQTKWERIWEGCKKWSNESNTDYNIRKTEAMFMTKDRKKIRPPVLEMDDVRIELNNSIKYLGVTFDRTRNFNQHLTNIREKVMRVANKIVNITRKAYGNSAECIKAIVDRVAKPAALYASEIWGEAAEKVVNKKVMSAMQRPFLLAIARAYRTTSTAALQVLTGSPPWWIEARAICNEYRRNIEHINRARLDTSRAPGIARFLGILRAPSCRTRNTCYLYVDASVAACTGMGVVKRTGDEYTTERYRIRERLDTGIAETIAVIIGLRSCDELEADVVVSTDRLALVTKLTQGKTTNNFEVEVLKIIERRWVNGLHTRVVWVRRDQEEQAAANRAASRAQRDDAIIIDIQRWTYKNKQKRRAERQEEMITRWQEEWESTNKGRELFRHCGVVGFDLIKATFKATQLITGHGNLKEYLRRFNLVQTEGLCSCGTGPETQEHIMRTCTTERRRRAREAIRTRYGNLEIRLRNEGMVDEEQLTKLVLWAEETMEAEEYRHEETNSDEEDL